MLWVRISSAKTWSANYHSAPGLSSRLEASLGFVLYHTLPLLSARFTTQLASPFLIWVFNLACNFRSLLALQAPASMADHLLPCLLCKDHPLSLQRSLSNSLEAFFYSKAGCSSVLVQKFAFFCCPSMSLCDAIESYGAFMHVNLRSSSLASLAPVYWLFASPSIHHGDIEIVVSEKQHLRDNWCLSCPSPAIYSMRCIASPWHASTCFPTGWKLQGTISDNSLWCLEIWFSVCIYSQRHLLFVLSSFDSRNDAWARLTVEESIIFHWIAMVLSHHKPSIHLTYLLSASTIKGHRQFDESAVANGNARPFTLLQSGLDLSKLPILVTQVCSLARVVAKMIGCIMQSADHQDDCGILSVLSMSLITWQSQTALVSQTA